MLLDQCEQFVAGAVTETKPDKFRRRTVEQSALVKIFVFRNDCEAIDFCVSPDFLVGLGLQSKFADMLAVGKRRGNQARQFGRKIFVEQQLHAATVRRRSRSAAKVRQAWMSSALRSGKSSRISAAVMPPPR